MKTTRSLFQIFRAGRHTAMSGAVLDFSDHDVANAALVYDPTRLSAPLVLGHPKENEETFGEVRQLVARGDGLYAVADVGDVLTGLVRSGSYRYVSASFMMPDSYGNPAPGAYYLRHVGFLGAVPPAVKGMVPPAFGEESAIQSFAIGITATPAAMGFTAPAGFTVDPRNLGLHRAAVAFQEACPDLSYAEAITLVHPANQRA